MKLVTPLGEITVWINDKEIPYTFEKCENDTTCKELDGRYSIEVAFQPDGKEHFVSCCLHNCVPINPSREDGERLECMSYYNSDETIKVSIGMFADTCYYYNKKGKLVRDSEFDYDTDCEQRDGCYRSSYQLLPDTETNRFWFGIAWLCHCTKKNDHHTWYGVETWYEMMKKRTER